MSEKAPYREPEKTPVVVVSRWWHTIPIFHFCWLARCCVLVACCFCAVGSSNYSTRVFEVSRPCGCIPWTNICMNQCSSEASHVTIIAGLTPAILLVLLQASVLWQASPSELFISSSLATIVTGVVIGVALYHPFLPCVPTPMVHPSKSQGASQFPILEGLRWSIIEELIRIIACLSQLPPCWGTKRTSLQCAGWLSDLGAGLFQCGVLVMGMDVTRSWILFVRHERILIMPGSTLGPLLCAAWCRPLARLLTDHGHQRGLYDITDEVKDIYRTLAIGASFSVLFRWASICMWDLTRGSIWATPLIYIVALEVFLVWAMLAACFTVSPPKGWRKR